MGHAWSANGTKKLTVKLDLQKGPSPCSTLVTTCKRQWQPIQYPTASVPAACCALHALFPCVDGACLHQIRTC